MLGNQPRPDPRVEAKRAVGPFLRGAAEPAKVKVEAARPHGEWTLFFEVATRAGAATSSRPIGKDIAGLATQRPEIQELPKKAQGFQRL